jgi:uncharacterized membrane protein YfcA
MATLNGMECRKARRRVPRGGPTPSAHAKRDRAAARALDASGLHADAHVKEQRMPALLVAIIGLGAGILSGLFGIGGGVVIVPLLIFVLGFSAQQAAGTSLAALLLPVGLFGAIQYWQAGQVNVLNAAMLALGLLFGAFLGARLGLALPGEVVQRAFGVLLVLVGLRMTFFA